MKKITAVVLCISLVFCFTGCASRSSSSTTEATTVATIVTTTPEVTSSTTVTTKNRNTSSTTVSTTEETKTTTTVTKKTKPVKKRVELKVKNIQQLPELPMGCEAVSASIALQWYGFKVDKFSLLPYQPMMEEPTEDGVWGDPNEVFVGDPTTRKWGCFSPVIKKAIEDYFAAKKVTDYEVISLNGTDFKDLYQEIDNSNPIIIWVTTKMQDIEEGETWKLKDGSTFVWPKHEHCVCMIGYDTVKDTVIISDPYDTDETVEYPRSIVEKVYNQMNKMALVIHKK